MNIPFFMGTSMGRSVHVPHKTMAGLKIVFHRHRVDLFLGLTRPLGHLEHKAGLLGFFNGMSWSYFREDGISWNIMRVLL